MTVPTTAPSNPSDGPNNDPVLEVTNLSVSFMTSDGDHRAVRNVDLTVNRGEILGIVGESGSGKSVTARSVLNLVPDPGRIVEGTIRFKGRDMLTMSKSEIRAMRGADIAMVMQEPMTSLNPVLTIGDQVAEVYRHHRDRIPSGRTIRESVVDILQKVRISDADRRVKEYPMHFSGGMRQRVCIAMGAAAQPSLIVADEPTTALDVTIQAQVLDLFLDLRDELGTSIVFITHDMGVVAQICDKVAVMYAGQIVEYGTTFDVFDRPEHPYTAALLRSLPKLDGRGGRLPSIPGQPPNLAALPAGCPFAPRCDRAIDQCVTTEPPMVTTSVDDSGVAHLSRCWLSGSDAAVDSSGTCVIP